MLKNYDVVLVVSVLSLLVAIIIMANLISNKIEKKKVLLSAITAIVMNAYGSIGISTYIEYFCTEFSKLRFCFSAFVIFLCSFTCSAFIYYIGEWIREKKEIIQMNKMLRMQDKMYRKRGAVIKKIYRKI